jgi:adenosyl cobinamide kinase/adenosyl cobinamide phosphate guanylyltransferase
MKLLEGIQLHELILIILGFILGLALIFIFLYTALRSKPNLKLLYGFIAPVVMIGYPSIQSVQFSKDVIKVEKSVEKFVQDPTDTAALNAMRADLENLPASRCKRSSDAMTAIANAQAAMGAFESAKANIEKAKAINPNNPNVLESEKEIKEHWSTQKEYEQTVKKLNEYIKLLNEKPNDAPLMDTLQKHVNELINKSQKQAAHFENDDLLVVAKAKAILGEKERAKEITTEILKVDPKYKEAKKLNEAIRNKEIDKKFKLQREREKEKEKEKVREEIKLRDSINDEPNSSSKVRQPQSVPAPAPVYQDTAAQRLRLIPRSVKPLKIWNKDE